MAVSEEQIQFTLDLFSGLGPLTTRKMFGGLALYSEGTIFAILMSEGTLRLKGSGEMKQIFDDAGWDQWLYTRDNGVSSSMPYWRFPDALLDDPDECCAWARRALAHL